MTFTKKMSLGEVDQIFQQTGFEIIKVHRINRASLPVEVRAKIHGQILEVTGLGNDLISAMNSAAQKLGLISNEEFIFADAR